MKREAEEDWAAIDGDADDPEARIGLALVRPMERQRLRCAGERHRGRAHLQGAGCCRIVETFHAASSVGALVIGLIAALLPGRLCGFAVYGSFPRWR